MMPSSNHLQAVSASTQKQFKLVHGMDWLQVMAAWWGFFKPGLSLVVSVCVCPVSALTRAVASPKTAEGQQAWAGHENRGADERAPKRKN